MGLFDIFKRKDNRYNHVLTEEDRQKALDTRAANKDLKEREQELKLAELELRSKLRQEELKLRLEDVKQQLCDFTEEEDEEESPNNADSMLMTLLTSILNKQQPQTVQPTPNGEVNSTSEVSLSDEQLTELISNVPKKFLKIGKKMEEGTLKTLISQQLPNVTPDTLERAAKMVKS
jgi:hypothetical protein